MNIDEFASTLAVFNPRLHLEQFATICEQLAAGCSRPQVAQQYAAVDYDSVEEEFAQANAAGVLRIHPNHEFFPESWRMMLDAPMGFYMLGAPVWKTSRGIAVVGSREPCTDNVRWLETHFSRYLKEYDTFVVSGAARGVDQLAHSIALKNRRPTVAILPSGLGRPYPESFADYFAAVLDGGGCIISEYAHRQPMRKHHFLHRNRLIASLCDQLLLVEARRRGGSAMTARLVGENGRGLGVVPSHPMFANGRGSLDFLKAGAMMITDAEDLAVWTGHPLAEVQSTLF